MLILNKALHENTKILKIKESKQKTLCADLTICRHSFCYPNLYKEVLPFIKQSFNLQTCQHFKFIFITVMSYNCPESGEAQHNKNPTQQSRTRLTLLADISQANPSAGQNQQESPVLTYLRQLQDSKSQAQKENIGSFNRMVSQSQDRNEKKNANKQPPKEQNPRKQVAVSFSPNWQDSLAKPQTRQTKIQSESVRRQQERQGTARPGIERYRKIINLAEPIEDLQNQSESIFQKSKFRSEYFNEDEDLLFKKELKKYNGRKFKP